MYKRLLMLLVVVCVAMPASLVWAQDGGEEESVPEIDAAVAWILEQQLPDGGFSDGFSEGSSLGATADAVFALAAAGVDVTTVVNEDGLSPIDYLVAGVSEGGVNPASLAKVVTALSALETLPEGLAEVDFVSELLASQNEDGIYVDDAAGIYGHCLVLIAVNNAVAGDPDEVVLASLEAADSALVRAQNEDGGWGFVADSPADTNTTAVCIQALADLGTEEANAGVGKALEYLGSIQNEDGGWPYQNPSDFGTDSDANSTSLVVQALVASYVDAEAWSAELIWDYLVGLQNESGSFSYSAAFAGDNFLATIGVVPALAGVPYNWAYLLAAPVEDAVAE